MTDKDKFEKVKAEIERLENYENENVTSSDTRFGWIHGKTFALTSIRVLLDSMQKEPKKCMYSTANFTNADRLTLCKDCKELCRYNQKTAAESLGISQEAYDEIVDKCLYGSEVELVNNGDLPKEEPVSEDLEQAIDTYLATYFGSEKEKQDWPFLKKMAIHFANWQKKKNDYAIEIAHMAGEEEGKNIMKQQMMAKAIDGEVGYWNLRGLSINTDLPRSVSEGDNVKIIVIKED